MFSQWFVPFTKPIRCPIHLIKQARYKMILKVRALTVAEQRRHKGPEAIWGGLQLTLSLAESSQSLSFLLILFFLLSILLSPHFCNSEWRLIQQIFMPGCTFLQNYSIIFIWKKLFWLLVKGKVERFHVKHDHGPEASACGLAGKRSPETQWAIHISRRERLQLRSIDFPWCLQDVPTWGTLQRWPRPQSS